MHGAGRDFSFFPPTFTRALFVGGPGAGIHHDCMCACVSVRYPFIIHLLLLLVSFSFSSSLSLAFLHLSEILINNQGSTMLRYPVMGS